MVEATAFPELLAYWLIAINFIAFAAFGIDKWLAESGRRRISEARLLGWALFGGTPGAYAGRQFFRHKTRKTSFSNALHTIGALQALFVVFGTVMGWHNFAAMVHALAG